MNTKIKTLERDTICTDCILSRYRTNIVKGRGNFIDPEIMIIEGAPSYESDLAGISATDNAGKLLDSALIGYPLPYITSIVKCRTDKDRDPCSLEMQTCNKYLQMEIDLLKPKKIIVLGRVPFTAFFPLRGHAAKKPFRIFIENRPFKFKDKHKNTIPVYPVYHPNYILLNKSLEATWVANVREILGDYNE